MTKHLKTRRWRLSIAAVAPLALAVCVTPPGPVDQASQIGDVAAPSVSAAGVAAEPAMPPPPVLEDAAVLPPLAQPALAAGLVGAGGASTQSAGVEPDAPPPPDVTGVTMIGALTEPGSPVGVGMDGAPSQATGAEPVAPPHPELAVERVMALSYPPSLSAPGSTVIEAPTDADFDRVRVLIARAEEVGAEFYDPQNLEAARAALRAAERVRGADPGGSRIALLAAEARATAAFENSVRLAAERLRKLLAERLEELREIEADRWVPVSFQELVDAVQGTEALYRSGDLFGAYELALTTADAMLALRDSLLDRLEVLYGARAEAERCLAEAQRLDTSEWTQRRLDQLQSLYQQLNALYLTGLEAMQSYRLTDAEEAFGAAVEVCRRLMAVADEAYVDEMERAAAMLLAVMREIEEASALTVVTDLGQVILPQPWSGQEVLDALRAGGSQRQAVLDGVEREDASALRKAQGLWIDGVVVNDDGKYRQAMAIFEDARRYLDLYKLYAVLAVYTVRYIPERRDSLWRIAEYDFHYGDPFLWPRIWRRNRNLIQNPDLIYPGWQLIIPAR